MRSQLRRVRAAPRKTDPSSGALRAQLMVYIFYPLFGIAGLLCIVLVTLLCTRHRLQLGMRVAFGKTDALRGLRKKTEVDSARERAEAGDDGDADVWRNGRRLDPAAVKAKKTRKLKKKQQSMFIGADDLPLPEGEENTAPPAKMPN